ncbi:MAG: DUF1538 domain-containing protein [Spirochaetaceae bacterium]|jgi:hypothetical protein|nr:DUF1538 domain-containing protein [Spirochaetaceae bacterium]
MNNSILRGKINEAFSSVLPVSVIVLLVSVIFTPIPSGTVLMFLVGAALLIVGMGFFTLGADMAMMPLGEGIGSSLTKSHNVFLIVVVTLIMGTVITIAEPDLTVLADQTPGIPDMTLIFTVAIGVGIFLVIAILRTLFKIRLSILLIIFYVGTFLLVYWAPQNFVPVAFDSGGVTTGPITVPFILALGAGVASLRSDKDSQNDSFGMVALCSIGPIIAVMILGMFFNPQGATVESTVVHTVETSRDVVVAFAEDFPVSFREVIQALAAIFGFFLVFQLISRRFKKHQLGRMLIGFLYTAIGLVVFLTGVEVGFIPVGHLIGFQMAALPSMKWLLVPISMVIGYFIVNAEPAVHVLNKQVEDITAGAITQKLMLRGLSIGMAIALGLTIVRIFLAIPILYILIPGYAIAIILTFFVPKIFTGVAFDSGGVCSGPMTSTFLLPLAKGVTEGHGGDMMKDAFGMVAMVAMTPLVVIQIIGLVYAAKLRKSKAAEAAEAEKLAGIARDITNFDKVELYG